MGIYYYLLNDTKRQSISYDSCNKRGPYKYNEALHMAVVNYMLENYGDTFRLVDDCGEFDEWYEYEAIDLSKHRFADPGISDIIKQKYKAVKGRNGNMLVFFPPF